MQPDDQQDVIERVARMAIHRREISDLAARVALLERRLARATLPPPEMRAVNTDGLPYVVKPQEEETP